MTTSELRPLSNAGPAAADAPMPAPTSFFLLRADDLLQIQVGLQGFTLHRTDDGYVLQTSTGGLITFALPSQHVMEALDTAASSKPVVSTATLLRWRVPANAPAIPLSLEGLLAATANLELAVDPALPGAPAIDDSGGSTPHSSSAALGVFSSAAFDSVTHMFLPGRIGLTPRGGAMRMRHAARAVAHGGAVELWHTRLARRTTSGRFVERTEDIVGTRTLLIPDATPDNPNSDWSKAVNAVSRLTDTEAAAVVSQSRQAPGSLKSRQLMLSPLGTWADLRGSWPDAPTLKSWRHEIAMGRDQSWRKTTAGRMYPLGHAALMVTTTERRLDGTNGRRAKLQTRMQITITEEVLPFTGNDAAARSFPFREIEILSVAPPEDKTFQVVTGAHVLKRGTSNPPKPFAYRCRGIDKGGRSVHFRMPLVFIANGFANLSGLATEYRKLVDAENSPYVARLDGQRVTIATPASAADAAGSDIVLDLAKVAHASGGAAGFRPLVREMAGWVPGIEDYGSNANALVMRYATQFIQSAGEFAGGNIGEVLLEIDGAPELSIVDAQTAGGLLSQLKFAPRGYSRRFGPVGGALADAALGKFDPVAFLGTQLQSMKLLGVFPLGALLSTRENVQGLASTPRVVAQTIDGARRQTFSWSAPLFTGLAKSIDVIAGRLRQAPNQQALLSVNGQAILDLETQQVSAHTSCSITGVEAAVVVLGAELVVVPLESVTFSAAPGHAPDVKVAVGKIGFGGALRYVRTLANLVDRSGFLAGNGIELLPDGVRTSFAVPVPGFAMGLFVIENISLGARFDLPFRDRVPELALNFSTFENPFRLAVLGIAGGGYVQVGVNMEGDVSLAAALEFGAAVAVNLGIARASVSIMGGIYFVLESGDWTITGYLRVNGRCEILGIASVSVELYVALTYIPAENAVLGEAEIVATVRLLFLKKTYRIPFQKKFAGPSDDESARAPAAAAALEAPAGPPGFAMAMAPPGFEGKRPWDTFCMAYAA